MVRKDLHLVEGAGQRAVVRAVVLRDVIEQWGMLGHWHRSYQEGQRGYAEESRS